MYLEREQSEKIKAIAGKTVKGIAAAGLAIAVAFGGYSCSQTAGCSRMYKTIHSDFDDGLVRVIYVYSMEGELTAVYAGKFDIDSNEERIIFDDEFDKRHQIYIGTGSAIIDEITEEELKEIRKEDNTKVYTKTSSNSKSL